MNTIKDMSHLPFSNVSNCDLNDLLKCPASLNYLSEHLNFDLRNFLVKSNKYVTQSLDCSYYTCEEFNSRFNRCKHSFQFRIFHLNIRSLNSKIRAFCQLLDLLEIEFDVIVLSEIWTYNMEFYANILDGYCLYTDLPFNTSVGGVGMYIKKSLCSKLRNDLQLSTSVDSRVENLWLEITKNNVRYIVGGIYRHPNSNLEEFTSLLEKNLSKIVRGKLPCFIAGNMNIDLLKVEKDRSVLNYANNLLIHSCLPTTLLPTRVTKTSATFIDHIYYYEGCYSKKGLKLASGNLLSDITDHFPTFVLLPCVINKTDMSDRPFIRLYTDRNKNKFHEHLSMVNWQQGLYCYGDVNML